MEDENEVGRGFMQTRDSKLLAHTGWAFVPEQNETNFVFVSGNVVIDFEEPFKAHPDFKPVRKLPSTRYHRGRMNQGTVDCLAVWYWTEGQELKEFQTTDVSCLGLKIIFHTSPRENTVAIMILFCLV